MKDFTKSPYYKKYGDKYLKYREMDKGATSFPSELGRLFLSEVLKAIEKGEVVFIDRRNWCIYRKFRWQPKIRICQILSLDHRGSEMLSRVEEIAREQKCSIVATCLAETPARKWWEKKGFKKISERRSSTNKLLIEFQKVFE